MGFHPQRLLETLAYTNQHDVDLLGRIPGETRLWALKSLVKLVHKDFMWVCEPYKLAAR